jgi:hypothetical protein
MNLYNRPTILIYKQCGLTRVADNYDEAKKAEVHGKESKHSPGRPGSGRPLVSMEGCEA